MKFDQELIEILGVTEVSVQKLQRIVKLVEEAQYSAYAEGYNDGFKDAEFTPDTTSEVQYE